MWRTTETISRRRCVRRPGDRRMILGDCETSCDDTCAAVVTPDGQILANVISSQGIHDRYGGVVPEIASRHHLELIDGAVADALRQAGTTLPELELVAVTQGPGLVAALLVGMASAKATGRGPRAAAGRRSTTSTATSPPASSTARRSSRPSSAWSPAVATRSSPASGTADRTSRFSARRLTTPPGRRSTRAPGCSGSAIRAARRSSGWRATAIRRPSPSPPAARLRGLDFSFAGLKTALLYHVARSR